MGNDFDPVYTDGSGILRNRLRITDPDMLEEVALAYSDRVALGMMELGREGIPIKVSGWNTELLKNIHRAMLGKIYDWAGEYRKVDIGIEYDHVAYEHWENVPDKLEEVFAYIRKHKCFMEMGFADKVKNLALVFGMIKNLQPFRDGNTRTALVFTSLLAGRCGMVLDYASLDTENFRRAQVLARDGNYNPLVMQFAMMTFDEKDIPQLKMPKVLVSRTSDDIAEMVEGRCGRSSSLKTRPVREMDR